MATAPAALLVLLPIEAPIVDPAGMRLGRLAAEGQVVARNAPKPAPAIRRGPATPFIAITQSRATMVPARMARATMVPARMVRGPWVRAPMPHATMARALGARATTPHVTMARATTPHGTMAHVTMAHVTMAHVTMAHARAGNLPRHVANTSRVRRGRAHRSACPPRHSATANPTRRGTRPTRRKAPSGYTATTPSPRHSPIPTAACAACC
jgi:hypothetical protein